MAFATAGSRRWVWFFAVLAIFGVLWLAGLYFFSRKHQLTQQRLDEARALWQKKRPRNYDLTYTEKGGTLGKFFVEVRDGQVKAVTLDGRGITQDDKPLDPHSYPRYDISGRFNDVEDFLKRDAEPGRPRVIALAQFDAEDGHLLHYTRKVPGTGEFIELTDIVLTPLPDEAGRKTAPKGGTSKP